MIESAASIMPNENFEMQTSPNCTLTPGRRVAVTPGSQETLSVLQMNSWKLERRPAVSGCQCTGGAQAATTTSVEPADTATLSGYQRAADVSSKEERCHASISSDASRSAR